MKVRLRLGRAWLMGMVLPCNKQPRVPLVSQSAFYVHETSVRVPTNVNPPGSYHTSRQSIWRSGWTCRRVSSGPKCTRLLNRWTRWWPAPLGVPPSGPRAWEEEEESVMSERASWEDQLHLRLMWRYFMYCVALLASLIIHSVCVPAGKLGLRLNINESCC